MTAGASSNTAAAVRQALRESTGRSKEEEVYALASVEALCRDQCWCELASRMLPASQPKPLTPQAGADTEDETDAERHLLSDLLSQLHELRVPTDVMVVIVSLSRQKKERRPPPSRWPNCCLPATMHSLQQSNSASTSREAYLTLAQGHIMTRSPRKQSELVRLLTLVLYLTSDEDTLERMLELVFEAQLELDYADDESTVVTAYSVLTASTAARPHDAVLTEEEKSLVIQRAEFVADKIGDAARSVSSALERGFVPKVNGGLDKAGGYVISHLEPAIEPMVNRRTGAITRTATGIARRGTAGVRSSVKAVTSGVRGGAATVATKVGKKAIDDKDVSTHDVETKERNELLTAAGHIGMAVGGAAVVVGEAIIDSSRAVASKGCNVTANIVRYRHGDDAGQILEDVLESTGNIILIRNNAVSVTKDLTKEVMKNHIR